jgi:predicted nucleic acid-binding protein
LSTGPFLLDTSTVSRADSIRRRISLPDFVGSLTLVVPQVAVRELSAGRYPDARDRWFASIGSLPVVPETEEIIELAERLAARYEAHDDPPEPADSIIAATSLVIAAPVITENWRDFHFVEGLRYVDIRGLTAAEIPVLSHRTVQAGGPANTGGCCRRLAPIGQGKP